AFANMQRALAICSEVARLDQGNVEIVSQLSVTRKIAGQIYVDLNDLSNAAKEFEAAERLRLGLLKKSDQNAEYQYFLVELYQQKSACYALRQQFRQQERYLREALRSITILCDQQPNNARFQHQQIDILIDLTDLLTRTARAEEAAALIS